MPDTTVQAAFDEAAAGYDVLRRRLIPPFDRFYGSAVDALALARRPVRRVLDLGAGTGILSLRVAAAYPGAELVLVDGAPAMLEEARGKLAGTVTLHVADLRDPLPGDSFDAVVSALAIHHLQDADKRDLYARAHDALAPGGVFVNAEQVAGSTPLLRGRRSAGRSDADHRAGLPARPAPPGHGSPLNYYVPGLVSFAWAA
jgi:tRNA (cmo5U34)-methyltransferase